MERAGPASGSSRVVVRYRTRALRAEDVAFLRNTIASGQFRGRRDLAARVCAAWEWRQANGRLAVFACQDLLLRLEEWGHLCLPGRRRGSASVERIGPPARRTHPLLPIDLIPIAGLEVRDPFADLDTLVVRPLDAEERFGWRVYMARYHPLGAAPLIGEHLLYGAWVDEELVALLSWAAAALRAPLREAFIGWDEDTKRRHLGRVTNNTRFLVLPWVRVRNLASKVLGANLRRLSRDWHAAWNHPVWLAETFVDTRRYRGTCYRAANWRYLGETAGRSKRGNAYLHGGTPKAMFVYELHRHARRWLRGEPPP